MDAHHHNLARRLELLESELATLRRRPAWPMPITSGLSACDTIRFMISGSPAPLLATGTILAVPAGCSVNSLPGLFIGLGGTPQVQICDPLGCFFNEPTGELITRTGWAKYMQPISVNACQPNPYYPFEPEWEVFSLCCAVPQCG